MVLFFQVLGGLREHFTSPVVVLGERREVRQEAFLCGVELMVLAVALS